MSHYWQNRLKQIIDEQYDEGVRTTTELKRVYRRALREIEVAYEELYIRMLEDGEVSPLTQYKFNRYKKLEEQIVSELKKLGSKEVELMSGVLIESFVKVASETNKVIGSSFDNLQLHTFAKKAVEMKWKDGNFSSRIWKNKQKLLSRLKKMVTDSVALGKSKDESVKDLMRVMGVGFNEADRLVRTELMHIMNQAQKQMYTDRGYRKYTLLPHVDDRTSEICKNIDESQEYLFLQAITGTNYPPLHPRCRTIAIPVIESNELLKITSENIEDSGSNSRENAIITLDDVIYTKLLDVARNINFKGVLLKESNLIDITDFEFAEYHIQEERKHGVTKDEAQQFINHAQVVFSRWNGEVLFFISHIGVSMVNMQEKVVSTAYKRREFDPKVMKILEVMNDE